MNGERQETGSADGAAVAAGEPTRADRVVQLQEQYGGTTFSRLPQGDGTVIVALEKENGGVRVAGKGANTEEALADLESKLSKFGGIFE